MQQQPQTTCESFDLEWLRIKQDIDSLTLSSDEGHHRVGIALIGLGRMGLVHLYNLFCEPKAELLYCFDADQSRLDSLAKSMLFKQYKVKTLPCEQFHLALEDPRVHAVIVTTPTNFHERYTRQALEAGKNVMCEKPLSPDTNEILPLFELAKEQKRFLLCAFNKRYDPDYRHLRSRSSQVDTFGSLQLIKIVSRDNEKPPLSYLSVSKSLFHDSVVHDFNLSVWMMRQLPVSVQAVGRTWQEYYDSEPKQLSQLSDADSKSLRELNDYFIVLVTMKFPDGSLCVIDNSREALYGYDQRCEIYGAKGILKCDGKPAANVLEYTGEGIHSPTLNYHFASKFKSAYMNELRDLISMAELTINGQYDDEAAVCKKLLEHPRPTLIYATHRIADACHEAAREAKTVTIDWGKDFEERFYREIAL